MADGIVLLLSLVFTIYVTFDRSEVEDTQKEAFVRIAKEIDRSDLFMIQAQIQAQIVYEKKNEREVAQNEH